MRYEKRNKNLLKSIGLDNACETFKILKRVEKILPEMINVMRLWCTHLASSHAPK